MSNPPHYIEAHDGGDLEGTLARQAPTTAALSGGIVTPVTH